MDPFEEIYRKYQPDIYRFLLRLCTYDRAAAEELTQETFFQAFLSFEKFRGACKIRTWLCQIAHNVYVQHVKREQKTRHADIAETELPAPEDMEADSEQREMLAAVRSVMAALDEPMRTVAEYRLLSELSYDEIAALLHMRPNTAAVMFHRAKEKIRKELREEYGYEI